MMKYSNDDMIKECVKVIKKKQCTFIDEIFIHTTFCSSTFYNNDLGKVDSIKEAIKENVVSMKAGLRRKWYNNDNATTQIALYKLIGDDKELDKLNSQRIDHTSKGEKISIAVAPPVATPDQND